MKVSNHGFKVRWAEAESACGVRLADMQSRTYNVTMTVYGEQGQRLELELTPAELDKLIEAREKMLRYNAGDFIEYKSPEFPPYEPR